MGTQMESLSFLSLPLTLINTSPTHTHTHKVHRESRAMQWKVEVERIRLGASIIRGAFRSHTAELLNV